MEQFQQSKETEHALEDILLMAEDSTENRRTLLEAGVIPLVLGVWQRNVRSRANHLRSGAVSALRGMATGSQENKVQIFSKTSIFMLVSHSTTDHSLT